MSSGKLTPEIARIQEIMMGHLVNQLTAVVARLRVPDFLATRAHTADELAVICNVSSEAMVRLLRAATETGLLWEEGLLFSLTPVGQMLRSGTPGSLREAVISTAAPGTVLPILHLFDAVRTGQPTARAALGSDLWNYYEKNPEEGACFARAMSRTSQIVVQQVLDSGYEFDQFRLVVDVGGGEGVMLASILDIVPNAKGVLFDRPDVIRSGGEMVRAYGHEDRLVQVAGNLLEEVPAGGDLYILKNILHDWDDARATEILKNIHRTSCTEAKILVVEMIRPPNVKPSPIYLLDLLMLVQLGGRERNEQEFSDLFAASGFELSRVIPVDVAGHISIIEGVRM